jgi:hypothetical protein
MLPTRLNFLPKEKQRYLHQAVMGSVTTHILETILLCLCVCTIAILLGFLFIESHYRRVAESTINIETQHTGQGQTIREANYLIEQTYAIEKQTPLLTPLIVSITEAIPSGISLDQLRIDVTKKEVLISGIAQTRDAYLALETALGTISFIEDIQIPLSDLTQKTNIGFSFTMSMR